MPEDPHLPDAPPEGMPEPERDELDLRMAALVDDDLNRGMAFFRGRLGPAESAYLQACVRCGLCAESCHYFRTAPEAENIPGHKLGIVASAARARTLAGAMLGSLVGVRDFDREAVRAWMDAAYGRCTLCGRCSLNCTIGINIPAILRNARGALGVMGLTPPDLAVVVQSSLDTGNNMAIPTQEFLDTVQWLEEELQAETGDATARIPVDKVGARVLLTINPREPKFYPLSLLASARVFHEAGEDWTVSSRGWDLTNYALFTGSPKDGGAIARNLLEEARALDVKLIAMGECGHGYAAARWEGPEWLQRPHGIPLVSVLELLVQYLREDRIRVDGRRIAARITLHDPCNLVRHGGVVEPQREILRRLGVDFVEMTPNREHNFCCGGGGGQLSIGRYRNRRVAAGGVKAEQIRATGAQIVATPCHNCQDQLADLNREYQLGVTVQSLTELVAEALVPHDPTPSEPTP